LDDITKLELVGEGAIQEWNYWRGLLGQVSAGKKSTNGFQMKNEKTQDKALGYKVRWMVIPDMCGCEVYDQ